MMLILGRPPRRRDFHRQLALARDAAPGIDGEADEQENNCHHPAIMF